ncbi:MAG: acyl-CoA thioesterase [Anaerolineae bacterium]
MLEQCRYQMVVAVRFADMDAMGHLNNAKYLTYCEQARIEYMRDVCAWQNHDPQGQGMILARTEIDYRQPITLADRVVVHLRVIRLGNKSFEMAYLITRQHGDDAPAISAEVKSVQVCYDYATEQTISIPVEWRERISAYEPAL